MRLTAFAVTAAALLLCATSPAGAQQLAFSGSRTATNIPPGAPDLARCGAAPNVLLGGIFGVGSSNLGAFTTVESNCLNPAAGQLFGGLWQFIFADASTLFGTATGTVGLPPVGGEAPVALTFSVAGGTGQYVNASGNLAVGGRILFNPGGTTTSIVDITGSITTVPEPTTVALVGVGLVGVAAAARRGARRDRGA